jgi:sugar phosphate isomerase/epimerase
MPPRLRRHPDLDRRRVIRQCGLAAVGTAVAPNWTDAWPDALSRPAAAAGRLFSAYGITAPVARAAELKALGAEYLVEHVADFLMPDAPDAAFELQRERAASAPIPVRGCNVFLKTGLRCTGPDADHARVLAYAAIAFERLERAGGSFIGLGSSDARRIPEGWPKARADEQFIALLEAMAPLAARHHITVSVESQRREEVNYLNRIAEVVAVVAAVDHPNIRVLADFYHMAVMGDSLADIEAAGRWVGLTEIAERETRTVPGVAGDDFRRAFAAIARAGYRGPITIEGNGTPDQLRRAFAVIDTQSREALAAASRQAG